MSLKMPRKAILLAAGLGKRLRPYTDETPKPLLKIAGKPLIDWTLDQLDQGGISEVIINSFYGADKLQDHITRRLYPKITLVVEKELLGTGGAIKAMLPDFDGQPFFALHSNIIWINKGRSVFARLADYWDDGAMDGLALIVDKTKLSWYKGKGDYALLDTDYRLKPLATGQESPIVAAGIFLIHPRAFATMPDGVFPLAQLIEHIAAKGRFFGLSHQGDWFGVNTAQDYLAVNRLLSD